MAESVRKISRNPADVCSAPLQTETPWIHICFIQKLLGLMVKSIRRQFPKAARWMHLRLTRRLTTRDLENVLHLFPFHEELYVLL